MIDIATDALQVSLSILVLPDENQDYNIDNTGHLNAQETVIVGIPIVIYQKVI